MSERSRNKVIVKNTAMLYLMNIAKLLLPLVTLPYLTRVLSKDCYGTVAYVKSVMQYMQIVVDFGFLLSATKEIVQVKDDRAAISRVVGDTLLAKLLLTAAAFAALVLLMGAIPLLRAYWLFTALSFLNVALSCFLMDFLFQGLEEMQIITLRYVVMRVVSTGLTFVFVKADVDLLWIPILDILGTCVAIGLVFCEMRKRGVGIRMTGWKGAFVKLKESAVFFLSNMATTTFTALNTLLIGVCLDAQQVAEWSVCLQLVMAAMSLYTPVIDGIYPDMVRRRDWRLIRKTGRIYLPLITAGCVLTYFAAELALTIVGGEKYVTAVPLLRAFIPLLFVTFPEMLLGWPALGAIGRAQEVTRTTLVAAAMQVAGLAWLLLTGRFTAINLAWLRCGTECCLLGMRCGYCRKFAGEFVAVSSTQKQDAPM